MTTSRITRKGQVTIPKGIRDSLDLKEGERVFFALRGEEVVLRVLRGNILELRGTVEPSQRPEDFDNVRKAVRERVSKKISRNG